MQIVIDLPEKTIAHIRSDYGHGKGFYPLNEEDKKIVNDAIYFGTPLPEHHGRLIDENELIDEIVCEEIDGRYYDIIYAHSIYDSSTIIEGSESE